MKKKRLKNNRKSYVLAFLLILISFYFYYSLSAKGSAESESKINIYSEEPLKYIIVVSADENGHFLCDSPVNNFCFYQGVYYDEKEINDKLYTYFENEYREVVEYEGSFFIKEEKYRENLNIKVGERSKNRVTFFRNVYSKENSLTKNERIISLIKLFLEKSKEVNAENKVSFIFSDGNFTDFMKLRDIREEALVKLLSENRVSLGDTLIKDKLISLEADKENENISLLYFTSSNKAENFTVKDEFNFKNMVFINILSPPDILGNKAETSEKQSETFTKTDLFSENSEKYMEKVFYAIHKKEPLTLVRDS